MSLTLMSERVTETLTRLIYSRPLTFNEWLDTGNLDEMYELVDGMLVEKPMVQLEHEKLETWIIQIVGGYIQERNLGMLLHSRSPVKITEFRGRMPDLFFVRQERLGIIGQKATTEAPDLVIEIISPGDGPADVRSLETDYRLIGVNEIVFADQGRRRIRMLRREETSYTEDTISTGDITLRSLDGLILPLDWLFLEPRPTLRATLAYLLGETPDPPKAS